MAKIPNRPLRPNRPNGSGAISHPSVTNKAIQQENLLQEKIKLSNPNTIETIASIEKYIAPLSDNEFDLLLESVRANGVYDPLKVWSFDDKQILIDGHHRRKAAIEAGTKLVPVVEIQGLDNIDDVQEWMLKNQLGRRNINIVFASFLRGRRYAEELKKETQEAAKVISAMFSVTDRTLRNDKMLYVAIDFLSKKDAAYMHILLHPETVDKAELDERSQKIADMGIGQLRTLGKLLAEDDEFNFDQWLTVQSPMTSKATTKSGKAKTSSVIPVFDKFVKTFERPAKAFTDKSFLKALKQASIEDRQTVIEQAEKQLKEMESLLNHLKEQF
ncbi:ParB/RepB/Spo0J family partition protein [Persicobacter psychrovividus]|uniref:ParB-like N-terminal domain-containing protein n=1 Tax=Persicobacter psychrovividus TaxID=387638 RepID=A0ABM7VLW7_9BACT|nr:hypothetical protein PEPS_42400 [Persicobacter psychrovividus]